jgi:hypothetical protein
MSTKKTQPEALTPRQVTMVFAEIASTAQALDAVLGILEVDGAEGDSDRSALTTAAVLINQRIGLLAELYGERCGELRPILVRGGADAWLMPRAFSS